MSKELDTETGLYYYGARYLDPKYSRWLSGDPALGEYIPQAPVNDEAKKHNENLPGMGGVFNTVNLHVYHYAGNNPIKYVDPDGESATSTVVGWIGTDIATPEPTDAVLWKWVGYGVVIAGAVVIDYFAAKTVSKASAKAKEQTEQEQTPDANAIRFQVQVGSETSASVVKTSQDKKFGVKKAHAYEALMELYTSAVSKEPGLGRCEGFRSAIIRMSKSIRNVHGIFDGGNVMRESFKYQGKDYRIDLENLRGTNLVE